MSHILSGLLLSSFLFQIVYVRGAETVMANPAVDQACANALAGYATPVEVPLEKTDTNLDFDIWDGRTHNKIYRDSQTVAHIAANAGAGASLVVAFADQGNSGVSAFFEDDKDLELKVENVTAAPVNESIPNYLRDDRMHGIEATIRANVRKLKIKNFDLGDIRHIRDYENDRIKPASIAERVDVFQDFIRVVRVADNGHRYQMNFLADKNCYFSQDKATGEIAISLKPGLQPSKTPLEFRVVARTSEKALTPLLRSRILKPEVARLMPPQILNMLDFSVYQEKWLAGSWRYLTYFGRDTLLSVKLMMRALQPDAVAAGLGAVLERVNHEGRVSHEETLPDYAYYLSGGRSFKTIQDYKMIDDDYMLAPIVHMFVHSLSPSDARAFLNRKRSDGLTYGDVLKLNRDFVLRSAIPFADAVAKNDPRAFEKLIHLRDGEMTGNWRDSNMGLGFARIPFDVNAALVPAALRAIRAFSQSDEYGMRDATLAEKSEYAYEAWNTKAAPYFLVSIDASEAERLAGQYARSIRIKLPSPEFHNRLQFFAIGLNADGSPVKIMNSDEGSYMTFTHPTEDQLNIIADRVLETFPYGLKSNVGLLVANPAFAPGIQKDFTPDHYHGAVVWGREQVLYLDGLLVQLRRKDLDSETRLKMLMALKEIWKIMEDTKSYQTSELWTWEPDEQGNMRFVEYGSKPSHLTKANPIQLWCLAGIVFRKAVHSEVLTYLNELDHSTGSQPERRQASFER